jgi:hypothetical protein
MTTFTFNLTGGTGFDSQGGVNVPNLPDITVTLDGSAVSENNHVHLLSGNTATTDLYLGDDDQYVKIKKNQGGVTISTIIVGIPGSITKITDNQGWGNDQIGPALATTGGTGTGLTVDVNDGGSGYAVISINTPGTGYTVGDVITVTSDDNSISDNFTINTVTNGAASTWQFSRDGSLTFPDATVQRSAYQTGQQTILVDEGSALGANIEISALTGSMIIIRPADGYYTVDDTHYIDLPYGTAADVDIPLGTKITILNTYDGTVTINGWPFPGYDMSQYQTINLVYIYDGNPMGINTWWVTNSFLWD